MWSTFFKNIPHTIFTFQTKILRFKPKNKIKNRFMKFALEVALLKYSLIKKNSQGILGVNQCVHIELHYAFLLQDNNFLRHLFAPCFFILND